MYNYNNLNWVVTKCKKSWQIFLQEILNLVIAFAFENAKILGNHIVSIVLKSNTFLPPSSSAQLLCKIKYYRGHLQECTYVIVYAFENTKKNIW